jgi:hypothetical protein
MRDLFSESLNEPSGRLASVVLNKLTKGYETELSDDVRARLDRLIDVAGKPGLLARVRLAANLPFLFDHAPDWTSSRLIPLFWRSSSNAADLWSARKYSAHIGSPELFGLLKQPFLLLFNGSNTSAEDLKTFAKWLVIILLANRSDNAGYPLLSTEARSALRHAGVSVLPTVAHHFAIEMEDTPAQQKLVRWRTVIGPTFEAIWPLDVELQTSATTYKLVQILLATGEAFPEASAVILPFIQPDKRDRTAVFSISRAPDELYEAAPSTMLDMIAAVVGEKPLGSVYSLDKALSRLRAIDPTLLNTRKFQKLSTYASQHG